MKKTGLLLILAVVVAGLLLFLTRSSEEDVLKKKQAAVLAQQQKMMADMAVDSENQGTDTSMVNYDDGEMDESSVTQADKTISQIQAGSSSKNWIIGIIIIMTMVVVIIVLLAKVKKRYWPDILLFKTPSKVGVEGSIGNCKRCGIPIFGEGTVIAMQKKAVYVERSAVKAQFVEQQSGYRCSSCGREYCKDCLEKYASPNLSGGKVCPACNGNFQIIH